MLPTAPEGEEKESWSTSTTTLLKNASQFKDIGSTFPEPSSIKRTNKARPIIYKVMLGLPNFGVPNGVGNDVSQLY